MIAAHVAGTTAHVPRATEGVHLCADFWGCDPTVLTNEALLIELADAAAREAGATVCRRASVAFEPQSPFTVAGVTVALLLAESHLTIHSYPEEAYLAVDVFTCGTSCDPRRAYQFLKDRLAPAHDSMTVIERGRPPARSRPAQ
jgi:S-adenosylmethionine decarboxylase